MTGLSELQQLKTLYVTRRELMSQYNQLNNQAKAKMQSYYKPPKPQKKFWKFNIFKTGKPILIKASLSYLGIYLLVRVIVFIGALLLAIPVMFVDWLFSSNISSLFDKIIHYLSFPATWFAGLCTPLIRKITAIPEDLFEKNFVCFLAGLIIFVVLTIITFLVIDLIIMLLKNPVAKAKNRVIRRDNFTNALAGDILYEEYQKTQAYRNELQKINNTRRNLAIVTNSINESPAVHSDYKNETIVKKLITYISTGRAYNTRDAINLYHNEKREDERDYLQRAHLEEQKAIRMIQQKDAQRNEQYRQEMLAEEREQTRSTQNAEEDIRLTSNLLLFNMFRKH